MFAARPGQKSPTALHDESSADRDKDDGINYTTVDWREFMCNTWHLEPTLRSARAYFIRHLECVHPFRALEVTGVQMRHDAHSWEKNEQKERKKEKPLNEIIFFKPN